MDTEMNTWIRNHYSEHRVDRSQVQAAQRDIWEDIRALQSQVRELALQIGDLQKTLCELVCGSDEGDAPSIAQTVAANADAARFAGR